ncbi:hypothetical protein [Rhodospirillaceae bacterium SYSU D60014]|uniref:ArnT family glycosyltransferase n=1 Tax=Virgifigura deserti TaxID=2268457 RepID=UPI000E65FC31
MSERDISPAQIGAQIWVQATIVFTAALLIRLVNLDHDAHIDEFFHVLAARSWLAEGTLRIADGIYDRGALYTMGLGWWFGLFGDSLISARIPSALAGSLWVAAVFLWTRAVAGSGAAWIAAALFGLAPAAIWLSQFTRFYTVHGLLFWLGAAGVYHLFAHPFRRANIPARAAVAIGTAVCFAIATHLQVTTLIGILGIGLWVAYELATAWLRSGYSRPTRLLGIAALAGAAVLVAVVLVYSGLAEDLFRSYRSVAYWNRVNQDYPGFYFNLFLEQYPTLWPLLPAAALAAIAARPQPALFASLVFGTAFVLHSFAGNKLERYIYYAMPYFFVIWGIALAHWLPAFGRGLNAAADRTLSALEIGDRTWIRRPARWTLLAVVAAFLVLGNPAFTQTFGELLQPPEPERTEAWTTLREELAPLIESVDVLVTTDELRSLYYFGRSDILVNRIRLMETPNPAEFKDDPRTGRPIISATESVRLVLACYPTGLFISNEYYWRSPEGLTDAAADLLVAQAEPIVLPLDVKLHVYHWRNTEQPAPVACNKLPGITDPVEAPSPTTAPAS